jgi:rod shape-determining protein MreD
MIKAPSRSIVLGGFVIGILFEIVPLPQVLQPFRPWLLAMLLVYWAIEAPLMVGFGTAFVLGLLADLASASLLGEQAMRLVIMVSLVQRFRARLRFFPLWQQAVAVGMLLYVDRAVVAILHLVFGLPQMPLVNLLAPVVGIFLWPWLYVLIDMARLRARERS